MSVGSRVCCIIQCLPLHAVYYIANVQSMLRGATYARSVIRSIGGQSSNSLLQRNLKFSCNLIGILTKNVAGQNFRFVIVIHEYLTEL